MTTGREPSHKWTRFILFAFVICVFAVLVEPLTALGFKIADGLATRSYFSRILAYLLLAWGSWKCWDTLAVRRVLGLRDAVSCELLLGLRIWDVWCLFSGA